MEMVHRITCTTQTVAQYMDARFEWGRRDCVRMALSHIKRMGHKISLLKAGEYSSLRGGLRALKAAGYETLESALDARFDRIAPAAALPGDIIALPSDIELPALAIRLSNNAVLHTLNGGFAISEPKQFVAAWRVPCLAISKLKPSPSDADPAAYHAFIEKSWADFEPADGTIGEADPNV